MQDSAPASSVRECISVNADEATWAIKTTSLALRWSRTDSGDVRLTSMRTAGREWIATPTPMFSLSGEPTAAIEFREVTSVVEGDILRLRGEVYPLGLTATISWTVHEEYSVVVVELEVLNESDVAIEIGSLSSLRLCAVSDGGSQLAVLAGGRWDEAMPPRGYQLQTVDLDELRGTRSFGAADDGRSSGEHVPWFALMNSDGGLLASLVWSGRWGLDVEAQNNMSSINFGISDFAHLLQPGERIALPGVVMAGYSGELDDGANTWRHWVAEHWMPSVPEDWPWVQYNHWYAYYGDIDAERLIEEARHAADAGCEVFVIDDGWFRGRRPDSYVAGWGDWVEDRSKFPDGLQAFGENVREFGMKFGLWVEPERADECGELAQAHPDWLARRGDEPITRPGPTGAEGVHLCLGNPEVQQWMAADMIRVVQEYGVDWLKWDYNIGYGMGCAAGDHGHQPTDGHYAHTLGLYRVLDELRATCPNLVIENCASGGHRVDLGTLRHTHTNWISDYTRRAASCRQHVQGAGLFLPLQHLNTWVLNNRDTSECRSRMGGAFGVSSFMGEWSREERDVLRQAIQEYKRLRPFLDGERFLLSGPLHQDWDIWQLVHRSGEEFAIVAFHETGDIAEVRVKPRVPVQDPSYLVQCGDTDQSLVTSGVDLASSGMVISVPNKHDSTVVWACVVH